MWTALPCYSSSSTQPKPLGFNSGRRKSHHEEVLRLRADPPGRFNETAASAWRSRARPTLRLRGLEEGPFHPQHPLSHLFCMVMNGGQRGGVLYQRPEPSGLSHGAGEVALCHGGRPLSAPSILQNMPHCWREPTPFTRPEREHSTGPSPGSPAAPTITSLSRARARVNYGCDYLPAKTLM